MSNLIENAEQKTSKPLSGSYSGAYLTVASLASATAMLLVSVFIQFLSAENPITYAVIMAFGALLIVIAVIILQKVQVITKNKE